jgi:hypothetical protein
MLHVRDEEWVDVVRGTSPPARAAAIAAHLETCEQCERVRDLWLAVFQVTEQEHLYTPPGGVVRIARALLAAEQHPAEAAPVWAMLAFDSVREARAGIRGSPAGARHLLYLAGSLSIDLRLVAKRATTRHIAVGQVADAEQPDEGCSGCQVEIVAGERTVETTSANALGEFELQFVPEPDLALVVSVPNRRPVYVPLGNVVVGC